MNEKRANSIKKTNKSVCCAKKSRSYHKSFYYLWLILLFLLLDEMGQFSKELNCIQNMNALYRRFLSQSSPFLFQSKSLTHFSPTFNSFFSLYIFRKLSNFVEMRIRNIKPMFSKVINRNMRSIQLHQILCFQR